MRDCCGCAMVIGGCPLRVPRHPPLSVVGRLRRSTPDDSSSSEELAGSLQLVLAAHWRTIVATGPVNVRARP